MAADRGLRSAALPIAAAILLMVPLFATPVLPLVDFYDHVARYFVLARVESDAWLAQNYIAAWEMLPNLGLDLLSTPLLGAMAPLPAAKLIIAVILLVQFSGALFLQHALWRRIDALTVFLLVGLLYSFILNWGFSNFLLALGLVFWNAGLWLKLRDRLWLAAAICGIGAIVIFFCHGFAFAIYGLLVGALELARWWREDRDRPALLACVTAALMAQAIVPLVLFLQMPTSGASAADGTTVLDRVSHHAADGALAERLWLEFWYRLSTIFRVAESPYPVLDILSFFCLVAVIGWAVWKGWVQVHRYAGLPLILFGVLCVITPPTLFGVGFISDRLPLVLAMLAAASVRTANTSATGHKLVLGVAATIAIVRIGGVSVGWAEYGQAFADFRQVMAKMPRGALLNDLHPISGDMHGAMPRCQMYRPLAVMLDGAIVPLFAFPTQQPLRLTGPLRAAQEALPPRELSRFGSRPGYYDDLLADMAQDRAFQYVFICERDRLTRPLPASTQIVAEAGDMTLVKLR